MNSRLVYLVTLTCVLTLPAWSGAARAQPTPGAYADVSAQWGVFPVVTNSASGPLVAQPSDALRLDLLNNLPSTDPRDMTAGAWARASASAFPAPGEKALHSASFVNEAGPEGTLGMEAISTARVVTQWQVMSDGSFSSASAPLDTTLSFEGYLFGVNVGGDAWLAAVDATMNVYVNGGMSTVFHGGGRFERVGSVPKNLTETGGFLGEFSSTRRDGVPAGGAWIDFNGSFDDLFVVNVGDVFLVELILQTRAQGGIRNGEMLVNANFYDSGNFLLSVDDQPGLTLTQINPVPEPETYALLTIGLGLVGWTVGRRKRQSSAGKE